MAENDTSSSNPPAAISKREAQVKKLKDANSKYKDLLKMAKERIQSQEDELAKLKGEFFYF